MDRKHRFLSNVYSTSKPFLLRDELNLFWITIFSTDVKCNAGWRGLDVCRTIKCASMLQIIRTSSERKRHWQKHLENEPWGAGGEVTSEGSENRMNTQLHRVAKRNGPQARVYLRPGQMNAN